MYLPLRESRGSSGNGVAMAHGAHARRAAAARRRALLAVAGAALLVGGALLIAASRPRQLPAGVYRMVSMRITLVAGVRWLRLLRACSEPSPSADPRPSPVHARLARRRAAARPHPQAGA